MCPENDTVFRAVLRANNGLSRCSGCGCMVRPSHIANSPECDDAYEERRISRHA